MLTETLPLIRYDGRFRGIIAFHVAGHDVYFTPATSDEPSVFNAAEDIIAELTSVMQRSSCDSLNVYEVRTHMSGEFPTVGSFQIWKLLTVKSSWEPLVEGWLPIMCSADAAQLCDFEKDTTHLRQIDPDVLALFQPYIDGTVRR